MYLQELLKDYTDTIITKVSGQLGIRVHISHRQTLFSLITSGLSRSLAGCYWFPLH
ncbi:calcineurin temperature suppressor cts1 [Moniliophthora roreri]|nr:calcineurin temperature suppressor cts1 [Moniliophthora roreri]